jgi:nicotinamidase-related amidase
LLTPQNAVIALIDYQPEQYAGVRSVGHEELLAHVTMLGRIATVFEVPVVLSTVYVKHGMSGTNPELREALPGVPEIDRTSMNSWEDPDFRAAVQKTGRKKLVIAGLWTEVCVAFPTLDAIREGYEVFVVEDAIGGVSKTAHDAAMRRMEQAGAKPISVLGLACETSPSRPGPLPEGRYGRCHEYGSWRELTKGFCR